MLSESAIRKLQPRASVYRIMDGGELRGFGIRVTPNGDKAYFLRYTEAGKTRWLALGHHPHTPLSAAREKARAALSRLDQGLPVIEVPSPSATLEALLASWQSHQHANGRRNLAEVEQLLRANVPAAVWALPAKEVTPEHIRAALAEIHRRGVRVTANRVRAHLHSMFSYGLKADHDPRRMADPALFGIAVNPVSAVPRDAGAEIARERVLSWPEIRALWNSEELSWPARQACRLLLLTGQRVNEVCQAHWAEIDINGQLWTLPAIRSKNHRTHLIPLSPQVIELLEELRDIFVDTAWLFPYRNMIGGKQPWGDTALAHSVSRWQKAAGVTDCWKPQDLRRTMKTWAVSAGIGRDILDKVQNHALADVASRHYDRHDYLAEKRKAINQWATYLTNQIINPENNVIPFKRQA